MTEFPASPRWQKSKDYSDLIRKGIFERRKNGGTSGVTPLGYRVVWKNYQPRLLVDAQASFFIRELFEQACDSKQSLRGLFQDLSEKGMRSRNGNLMAPSSFRVILQNPYYAGFVRDDTGRWVTGSHEAIVEVETFNRVQRRLQKPEVGG